VLENGRPRTKLLQGDGYWPNLTNRYFVKKV